jgi:hypothetical protein
MDPVTDHKQCHISWASITPSLQSKLRRMRQGLTQQELTNNTSYHSDSPNEDSLLIPVSEESGQPPSVYPDYTDNFVENECLVRQPFPFSYIFHKPNSTQSFHRELMDGNAMKAASILVIRASLQRNCNLTGHTDDAVQPSNILLFLYLSKLVVGIGQFQEKNLSKVMKIIFPYVRRVEKGWLPIPTTVSGFRSIITNTSNSNSLVSILPIPGLQPCLMDMVTPPSTRYWLTHC